VLSRVYDDGAAGSKSPRISRTIVSDSRRKPGRSKQRAKSDQCATHSQPHPSGQKPGPPEAHINATL